MSAERRSPAIGNDDVRRRGRVNNVSYVSRDRSSLLYLQASYKRQWNAKHFSILKVMDVDRGGICVIIGTP